MMHKLEDKLTKYTDELPSSVLRRSKQQQQTINKFHRRSNKLKSGELRIGSSEKRKAKQKLAKLARIEEYKKYVKK